MKQKVLNLPPVRVSSEEFLLAVRAKSDETGIPVAFVQRRALEDWLGGLYDPTHSATSVILSAEARADADVMQNESELKYAQWEEKHPKEAKELAAKAHVGGRRDIRVKGDARR